jgi:hypothetical protein
MLDKDDTLLDLDDEFDNNDKDEFEDLRNGLDDQDMNIDSRTDQLILRNKNMTFGSRDETFDDDTTPKR